MKLLPLVLLAFLVSCTKNIDKSLHQNETAATTKNQPGLEACTFGIQSFNTVKRTTIQEPYAKTGRPKTTTPVVGTPNATILISFDGYRVNNTVWNTNGEINCAPANLAEQEIEKIITRVSEDYAPFNVVVTTDEAVYAATPANKRVRVVVTETWEWYGVVGGVAYYDSFTWGNNTPAFVFSTLMGYNEKYIAEGISHEVGHTLGLRHQGVYTNSCGLLNEYNMGAGNGEIGWAPIMGIGYYNNVTTWHKGPTTSCGTIQDDVAVLTNMLGKKADSHNSMHKPNELEGEIDGLISADNDVDYYALDVSKQPVTLTASPRCVFDCVGANMHMKINIYKKNGTLLKTVSDPVALEASTVLEKGKYVIGVETTENTNASRYGMLGNYRLAVN